MIDKLQNVLFHIDNILYFIVYTIEDYGDDFIEDEIPVISDIVNTVKNIITNPFDPIIYLKFAKFVIKYCDDIWDYLSKEMGSYETLEVMMIRMYNIKGILNFVEYLLSNPDNNILQDNNSNQDLNEFIDSILNYINLLDEYTKK